MFKIQITIIILSLFTLSIKNPWASTECGKFVVVSNPLLLHPKLKIEYLGSPGAKNIIYFFHGGGSNNRSWKTEEPSRLPEIRDLVLDRIDQTSQKDLAFGFVSLGQFWLLLNKPSSHSSIFQPSQYMDLLAREENKRGFNIENRIAVGHSLGVLNSLQLEFQFPGTFSRMIMTGPAMFSFDPTGFSFTNFRISFQEALFLKKVYGLDEVSFLRRLGHFIGLSLFAPMTYGNLTGRHNNDLSFKLGDLFKTFYATLSKPSKWNQIDPTAQVKELALDGRAFPPMSILTGEFDLRYRPGAQKFSKALKAQGIPHQIEVLDGVGHNGPFKHEAMADFIAEAL